MNDNENVLQMGPKAENISNLDDFRGKSSHQTAGYEENLPADGDGEDGFGDDMLMFGTIFEFIEEARNFLSETRHFEKISVAIDRNRAIMIVDGNKTDGATDH